MCVCVCYRYVALQVVGVVACADVLLMLAAAVAEVMELMSLQ